MNGQPIMCLVFLPGTGDPLAAALADQETVAGAPHIFPPRRGVPDGRGLVALWALDNMLQTHDNVKRVGCKLITRTDRPKKCNTSISDKKKWVWHSQSSKV